MFRFELESKLRVSPLITLVTVPQCTPPSRSLDYSSFGLRLPEGQGSGLKDLGSKANPFSNLPLLFYGAAKGSEDSEACTLDKPLNDVNSWFSQTRDSRET